MSSRPPSVHSDSTPTRDSDAANADSDINHNNASINGQNTEARAPPAIINPNDASRISTYDYEVYRAQQESDEDESDADVNADDERPRISKVPTLSVIHEDVPMGMGTGTGMGMGMGGEHNRDAGLWEARMKDAVQYGTMEKDKMDESVSTDMEGDVFSDGARVDGAITNTVSNPFTSPDDNLNPKPALNTMPSTFTGQTETLTSSPVSMTHPSSMNINMEKNANVIIMDNDTERGLNQLVFTSPGAESTSSQRPPRPLSKQILLVLACAMGMVINSASVTSVIIALPVIQREFGARQGQLQWPVSAYVLSSICLLILSGRLADLHGRKRAFLLGTALFTVFAVACGAAPSANIIVFDVLRGMQGVGPAVFGPASFGILAQAFPPSRARTIAFSTFSVGAPIGSAIGQQVGAILAQYTKATYRSSFFILAGLSALTFALGYFSIENDALTLSQSAEDDRRIDWHGAFLVTVGLVLVTVALSEGPLAPEQWKTPYIIAVLVIGLVLLTAFAFWQHHLERNINNPEFRPPLIKLSMWTRAGGKFAAVQVIAFFELASYVSWGYWGVLFMANYLNLSPTVSALHLIPNAVCGIAANIVVPLVIGSVDMVYLVVFGTITTSLAGLLLAVINPNATYWAFGFPAACTSVFGVDFVITAATLFVAKVSQPNEQSLAGGLLQTMVQLGTAFGLAITTNINERVLLDQTRKMGVALVQNETNAPRPAQLKAYQAAQWGAFSFAIFGALLAVLFLRGVGVVGENSAKPPPIPVSRSEATLVRPSSTTAKEIPPDAEKLPQGDKVSLDATTDGKRMLQTFQIQTYFDSNGIQQWSIVH